MLTEKYQKRIKPFITFYKFLYRARFYLITAGVLLASTGASLMGIKGMIVNDVILKDVSYGDKLEYQAKSIFNTNDLKYEFKSINSDEWVETEPYKVGTYEIRAVSSNIFGQKIYGTPCSFDIKPKKIKPVLKSKSSIYGEKVFFDLELEHDDVIKNQTNEVTHFMNGPQVIFSENSFKIGDINNEDVTNFYEIDLNPIDITLLPRNISLDASIKKTYDGKPLILDKCKDIVSGTLAYDDEMQVSKSDSLTNAGSILNNVQLDFNNVKEGDVSPLYNYKFTTRLLEVDKRNIEISLPDVTKVYDRKYTNINSFNITSGSLLPNHHFEIEYPQFVDVCDLEYEPLSYSIVDENGNDVTRNYDVKIIKGKVKIEPLEISVTTDSENFVYDGTNHNKINGKLTSGTLIEGDQLVFNDTLNEEKINVGTYKNKLDVDVIDSTGKSVKTNYAINVIYGDINIEKRIIDIRTRDYEVEFNKILTLDSLEAISYNESQLAPNQIIKVVPKIIAAIEPEKVYENDVQIEIFDASNNNVTNNYQINYTYGKIVTLKGKLELKTKESFFLYKEGKVYSDPGFISDEGINLPAGFTLGYEGDYTKVDKPGVYPNVVTPIVFDANNNDVTDKFIITVDYQNLIVYDSNNFDDVIGGEINPPDLNGTSPSLEERPEEAIPPTPEENPGEQPETKPEEKPDEKPEEKPEEGPGSKPEEEITPQEKKIIYSTNYDKDIYFKQNSYSDITGTILTKAPVYFTPSGTINPSLYVGNLLSKDKNWQSLNIKYGIQLRRDLSPQYPQLYPSEQAFDGFIILENKENSDFVFNTYDYIIDGEEPLDLSAISEKNKGFAEYESFVKANYLNVNVSLKEKILTLIDEYNLVGETEYNTIYNISRYITNNHKKDFYAGNKGENFIENFLFGNKTSNETVYAFSTVAMLRSLGIPARVASGYVRNAKDKEDNCVKTLANTWVEVYSSSAKAFVYIDPFRKEKEDYVLPEPSPDGTPEEGGGSENPGEGTEGEPGEGEGSEEGEPQNPGQGEGGDEQGEGKPEKPGEGEEGGKPEEPGEGGGGNIPGGGTGGGTNPGIDRDEITSETVILTASRTWVYDGQLHSDASYTIMNAENNLLPYDKLEIINYPKIKYYSSNGIMNAIKFKVIDTRNGKDVTKEYKDKIIFRYGTLKINKTPLTINSKDKSKAYDGTSLTGTFDDIYYSQNELKNGDTIRASDVKFLVKISEKISGKNIFKLNRIVDKDGNNVMFNYAITYNYGNLTIY